MSRKFSVTAIAACRLFSAWLCISFCGWCFEVIGRFLIYGVLEDRGFLRLPLCPIYGFCLLGVYFLFGTPQAPRALLTLLCRRMHGACIRWCLYFLCSAALCTLVELISGLALLRLGVQLWLYEQKFNFLGIICLRYSILWGALITPALWLLGDGARRFFSKISPHAAVVLALVFGIPVLADFVLKCAEVFGMANA